MTAYELYYWPNAPGRGEFIRLALEYASVPYIDVAREPEQGGRGIQALFRFLEDGELATPPFAAPYLKAGGRIIAQTANILLYLGMRHDLAPQDEADRLWTHQLQLTVADLVTETHDTHHPIAGMLYYEDQKEEAKRRARDFRENRLLKFLGYFETVLERNPRGDRYLVGNAISYVDLSMFQCVAGLRYAFPRAMSRYEAEFPLVDALHYRVAALPQLLGYFRSNRRMPFNQEGIFRHYPELDP